MYSAYPATGDQSAYPATGAQSAYPATGAQSAYPVSAGYDIAAAQQAQDYYGYNDYLQALQDGGYYGYEQAPLSAYPATYQEEQQQGQHAAAQRVPSVDIPVKEAAAAPEKSIEPPLPPAEMRHYKIMTMAEIALGVFLLFLLCGIVLVFLGQRPIAEEEVTEGFVYPSSGGASSGGISDDSKTVKSSDTTTAIEWSTQIVTTETTRSVVTKTTTKRSTTTTTTTTARSTTRRTTTTVEPRPVNLLPRTIFCTVGREATDLTRIPDDGLCDFMFYTHVNFLAEGWWTHHAGLTFNTFLDASRKGKVTRYGISIRRIVGSASQVSLWQASGEKEFKRLWDENVHHHGILDADGLEADLEAYERYDLKVLRSLRLFQRKFNDERLSHWRPSYIALGIRMTDYSSTSEVKAHAARIKSMVTSLPVHLLVAMSHVDPQNREGDCKVIAPTPWQYNYETVQPYLTAVSAMLQQAALPGNVTVMRSITMAMLYHKFDGPERPNVKLGDECESWTTWGFQEICSRGIPNATTDQAEKVQLSAFQDRFFGAVTWDTINTLTAKMKAMEAGYTIPNVGWALFDSEMGDYARCSQRSGPTFPRLRAVRDYFKGNP